ncbi:Serine/threonine-protein kinase 19 [Bienertia sinuspersici]
MERRGKGRKKKEESVIDNVSRKIGTKKESDFAVFDWFKSHVMMSKLEPSIAHEELVSCNIHCTLLSAGGRVKEEQISLLVNAGILTRQLVDANMYWIAIPNIGSILKGISQLIKQQSGLNTAREQRKTLNNFLNVSLAP